LAKTIAAKYTDAMVSAEVEWPIEGLPLYQAAWRNGMEAQEAENLAAAHGGIWGEHPDHPSSDWRAEVHNEDTRQGYWEWVANNRINADENTDRMAAA
jgi:hypothetical protein